MEKIAVIGAGLVGSLGAIYLAKRGFDVSIYERRPDMRKTTLSAGRSINLALSDRGWKALDGVGVSEEIREIAIPMYGRMMHGLDGQLTFQAYGKENQAIYSVSRGELNAKLMSCAEENGVKIEFNKRCLDIDLETNRMEFQDEILGETLLVSADRVLATDGAFSAVRSKYQLQDRFNYSQYYIKHGYKELVIPANLDGTHKLDKHALHIWPRGEFMLIALANLDGSFTCTLFFPFEGENSFESLKTEQQVLKFFNEVFPDAVPLMPTLVEDYFSNPTSSLITVKCEPWNYKDKSLLLGDAAHAIVPFFGQGMNSGFEDCTVLNEIMNQESDWDVIFNRFSSERKKDGDAIADLALQNFLEMRDLVGNKDYLLRKKIEKKIYEKYPNLWIPQYSQVTFSHIPYSVALSQGKVQEKIMDEIMNINNIHEIWDSELVENNILDLLRE